MTGIIWEHVDAGDGTWRCEARQRISGSTFPILIATRTMPNALAAKTYCDGMRLGLAPEQAALLVVEAMCDEARRQHRREAGRQ